ncbi:carbohydrate-binding protein [Reichenbachiella agarivorans]|uniref:Carbohydrate-binding protein n=1 Tax=Reichenbachiella agarivorans TaxID=2979464 RepID=A0ABY6CND0_9BACT|nr:carbohydrate-binding protein [Reichenbachiella agarivorans]UXP31992.1 carbohydrate-binding protein [Reichenbachiella agarivorans]
MVISVNLQARQFFDKSKDLLLANFDLKPDEDDIHSAAALASMLQHPDLAGIDYYVVAGAYGQQGGTYITSAVPGFYNSLFGTQNQKWTDAHNNWSASVTRVRDKVKSVLNAGGKVFVQEAGQSDFTYDLCQALLNDGVTAATIQSKIIVVQHSQWNEDQATQWKLNWVKNNTDYNKIDDGNSSNSTPGYNTSNTTWMNQAKAASNPNAASKSYWTQADQICDNWNASWENPNIAGGGVDFSDCSENWWIFNIGSDADNISKFWNRYVVNTPSSGGTDDISCNSLPSSIASSTTISVSVPYIASQSRDVVVEFWNNSWIATGSTTVGAGSGTATVIINLNSAPAVGSNYILKTSIRPVGATWQQNLDFCQINNLTVTNGGGNQAAYGGTPWSIPGRIEAQDYDMGGEGVAYHDTDATNNGGQYRTDGVDIENNGDSSGNFNIGWMNTGEWLEYTTNVNSTMNYHFYVRVSSINGNGQFKILVDGNDVSSTQSVPNTGGWQSYTTLTIPNVNLSSGQHVVRIEVVSGGMNLNFWSAWASPNARMLSENETKLSDELSQVTVYPMPLTHGDLTVQLHQNSNRQTQIALFSLDGRVLPIQYHEENAKIIITNASIPKGISLLRIGTDQNTQTIRVKK